MTCEARTGRFAVLPLLAILAAGGGEEPAPSPVRVQVSLSWGGGEPRAWSGEVRVESTPPDPEDVRPRVGSELLWLRDFEEGDLCRSGFLFEPPEQSVPPCWRLPAIGDFRRHEGRPPRTGAWLETTTQGDADGLVIDVVAAAPTARLLLDLGGEAHLESSLEDLLEGPQMIAVDDTGNVLLARATDLRSEAPLTIRHAGRTGYPAVLHAHTCFSSNTCALEPLAESLRPFARRVWWTDHSPGNDRRIFAGDFEDLDLVQRSWSADSFLAQLTGWYAVDEAFEGDHAFRLTARGLDEQRVGTAWIEETRGAGQLNAALFAEPVLRWAWNPLPDSGGAPSVACVNLQLASGLVLRYLSSDSPATDPATDLVLDAPTGEWQAVERDVAADVRAVLGDVGTDALRGVTFGLLCSGPEEAGVLWDAIAVELPGPLELLAAERARLRALEGLRSHPGFEQSSWASESSFGAIWPHLTALLPTPSPELVPRDRRAPTAGERRALVRSIHDAGGVVGTHHVQLDEHYARIVEERAYGADLLELGDAWWTVPAYVTEAERRDRDAHGYPALPEDELFPLLVRWDRMTARGLLLTGYGAPDLHGRFDRSAWGWMNRWLSTILAEDDDPRALLAALRAGQVCARTWDSPVTVDLTVDGRLWMGKVVATDRERHVVRARVSGAMPGTRVRWIGGELVRALAGSAVAEPGPIGNLGEERFEEPSFEAELEVAPRRARFVRAEVLDPTGAVVALSNPVVFTPFWPTRWPAGKVAFDWRGVSVRAGPGVRLDDARVSDEGALLLRGTAGKGGGELTLPGGRAQALRVKEGPFDLALTFDPPWDPVPTAELEATPPRKELWRVLELGTRAKEEGAELEGFGERFQGALLLQEVDGSWAAVERRPASFRLALPAGEPVWVKLRTQGYSRATGRLLLDGEELARFGRGSARTFAVPASAQDAEPGTEVEHVFTIELDPVEDWDVELDRLRLKRVEVWRGDGVVDY